MISKNAKGRLRTPKGATWRSSEIPLFSLGKRVADPKGANTSTPLPGAPRCPVSVHPSFATPTETHHPDSVSLLLPFLLLPGRGEAVVGLVPQAVRVVEAALLGEQECLHLLQLVGVARVVGEVPLVSLG